MEHFFKECVHTPNFKEERRITPPQEFFIPKEKLTGSDNFIVIECMETSSISFLCLEVALYYDVFSYDNISYKATLVLEKTEVRKSSRKINTLLYTRN